MKVTDRDRIRNQRKRNIIKSFEDNETLFTNEVAKRNKIVWPVADGLLQELVNENSLSGDKVNGYTLYKESKSFLEKVKNILHL